MQSAAAAYPAPTFDADAYLATRFAGGHECDRCGRGAEGHQVEIDRYREPFVRCLADIEEDPAVVRARSRRWMLGGLR